MNFAIIKYTRPPQSADIVHQMGLLADRLYMCNRPPRPSVAAVVDANDPMIVYMAGASPKIGYEHETCLTHGCLMVEGHCVRNVHAEVALIEGMKQRNLTSTNMMFSINKPCYNCTVSICDAKFAVVKYLFAVYNEFRTIQHEELHNLTSLQYFTTDKEAREFEYLMKKTTKIEYSGLSPYEVSLFGV